MKSRTLRLAPVALLLAALADSTAGLRAQNAFGVDSRGVLFNFQIAAPAATTAIGNLGFVPEAIDFRPGTSTLFAIDVGVSTVQLYTIDTATAVATPIGAGFSTAGSIAAATYNLAGSTSYGFDFNPTTLQADGSIRIRFVSNNGTDLRLHSATGGVAAIDGVINGAAGATIGALAYINSANQTIGGVTALYDVDFTNDALYLQNPPNNGTLSLVGSLGVNVGPDIAFDIFTVPDVSDPTIGGDLAFLADSTGVGSSTFYSVNLGTGAATSLGSLNVDFRGGLAIQPSAVPEPGHFALSGIVGLALMTAIRRRRQAKAV